MKMLFLKTSWERYKGQTDWKIKDTPGSGLIHIVCGQEMRVLHTQRTILTDDPGLGPCAAEGTKTVAILRCVHCHGEKDEEFGHQISMNELIEIS